jgi:uncharacterized protein
LNIVVEMAATIKSRESGLMNRHSLGDGKGMLFVFPKARRVQFWMRNTYLPLDILFLDVGGKVINIKHDAKPLDETIIESGGEVTYVLEVDGGYAEKNNITEGDSVSGPALKFHAEE